MKRNKTSCRKKRLYAEWCGIKKSIKEEMEDIAEKIKYRETFKLEEETTRSDKIIYWLIFGLGSLLCLYLFSGGFLLKAEKYILNYLMLNMFLGALFYTSRWKFIKILYIGVSKPFRVFLTCLFKVLKINYIVQHILQCFIALVVSGFCGVFVLSRLPGCLSLFCDAIKEAIPKEELASQMCIICFIIISMLVGMLLMYILLRAMLVVFVSGDRKSKLDIFQKIWKEMKLLFYLFVIILQFWGIVDGVLDMQVQCLLDAVLFIVVIDGYISMRNE